MLTEIKKLSKQILSEVVQHRRHLHANPELSFVEYKTSAYVKNILDDIGLPWKSVAKTGVEAIIKGNLPSGEVIALRADMDALPITEANNVNYASKNPGVMHACGHDFHTSSLLGVARLLHGISDHFGGT